MKISSICGISAVYFALMQCGYDYYAMARIDSSYYLDGDDEGRLNAFEEYAVRRLTNDVIENTYPDSIERYIDALTTEK